MPLSRNAEPLVHGILENEIYGYLDQKSMKPATRCRIPLPCSPTAARRFSPAAACVATSVTIPFQVRPKSASGASTKSQHESSKSPAHSIKPSRKPAWSTNNTPKKIPPKEAPKDKKLTNELIDRSMMKRISSKKNGDVIVPVMRRPGFKTHYARESMFLPNQETIKRMESKESPEMGLSPVFPDLDTKTSKTAVPSQLKRDYQDKLTQYQKFKKELKEKQQGITELYGRLQDMQAKMGSLGQRVALPPNDDLQVMDPASMTPEQLLHICSLARQKKAEKGDQIKTLVEENSFSIDFNKILRVPMCLIEACEQTLEKRKEIIEWLTELVQSDSKGIRMRNLVTKVNEFSGENQMLYGTLEKLKTDFLKEATEISDCLRNGVKEAMALHLRTEEMTYEMSELNSQNADLRKQLQIAESLKSHSHRAKIEELEKELKEEKSMRSMQRERLTRTEGQVKIGTERATQLEAALEQSRAQTWSLERTIADLKNQNNRVQLDFECELKKLQASIVDNTKQLEEIDEAREKLCAEKEKLEKRIQELSDNYDVSLETMGAEMKQKAMDFTELEQKYKEEKEQKQIMETKLETLCADLLKTEQRNGEITKLLKENEDKIGEVEDLRKDLIAAKQELEEVMKDAGEYKRQVMEKDKLINEMKVNITDSRLAAETLKVNLDAKEELLTALEMKQSLLQQQLRESESKMESYEIQLTKLKNQIKQTLEDFGEFENLTDLHEMIKQQRSKLLEATRQNGELAEELQKKDDEIDQHVSNLNEQAQLLQQKEELIRMYSEKEDEQAEIIKMLRHNLEVRTNRDSDMTEKLADKGKEIESLVVNVEKRKRQINEYENIVLALEEEIHSADLQRKGDQANIYALQKRVAELESVHVESPQNTESRVELDYLIKILEDELGSSVDASPRHNEISVSKKKHAGDSRDVSPNDVRSHGNSNAVIYRRDAGSKHPTFMNEHQKMPTKIVMGNFVKKTYLRSDDGQKRDMKFRDNEKYIQSDNGPKWSSVDIYNNPREMLRGSLSSKIDDINDFRKPDLLSYHLREGKQSKMFKLAGHRL